MEAAHRRQPPAAPRSLSLAYLILTFGGTLGLHHLYLGRPIQALLWSCSPGLGGFFWIGLLRDLFCIPSYVEASNDSEEVQDQLDVAMKYSKQPPWTFSRIIGCYMFGAWFAWCGSVWGPDVAPLMWFRLTGAVAAALGVWLAGNACTHQTGSIWNTMMGGIATACIFNAGYSPFGALVAFQWTRQWQPEVTKPRLARWKVPLLVCLFWTVTFWGFCEHASITTMVNGQPKTFNVKESIINIFRGISDTYEEMSKDEEFQNFNWEEFFTKGGADWNEKFKKFSNTLDVAGEKKALKTLGMTEFIGKTYSAADVKKNYRKAAKKWHPDHVRLADKQEAESMMQEINVAKELLDTLVT